MNTISTLIDLHTGECGTVRALTTRGAMRRRLLDLGIIPGTVVQTLFQSASGDPTAYLIQGAVIALRRDVAVTVKLN